MPLYQSMAMIGCFLKYPNKNIKKSAHNVRFFRT